MDRGGAWRATVHGVVKSQTQLITYIHVIYLPIREVPCFVIKFEMLLGTLDATPKVPQYTGLSEGSQQHPLQQQGRAVDLRMQVEY